MPLLLGQISCSICVMSLPAHTFNDVETMAVPHNGAHRDVLNTNHETHACSHQDRCMYDNIHTTGALNAEDNINTQDNT